MTVSVLRPNATNAQVGNSVTGAASAHAATNDDSDSSYVAGFLDSGDYVSFALGDLTLPAGAVVTRLVLALKLAAPAGNGALYVYVNSGSNFVDVYDANVNVVWSTPTLATVLTIADAILTDSFVDAVNVLVKGRDGGSVGETDLYELLLGAYYATKPTVTPSAPSGTITNTNEPTVSWTESLDAEGGAQTHYQVRVFTAAQYGAGGFNAASSPATYDSGDVASSALSHAITEPLADATYRAYVRVGQTVNGSTHWSDYAYTGFVIDVDLPAVPTLTLTALDDDAAIAIELAANSGAATTTAFELERSLDGGSSWEDVRLDTDTAGIVTDATPDPILDFEAPNGVAVQYRARALHDYSGSYAASDWTTGSATWASPSWWLKAPRQPALNLEVEIDGLPNVLRAARLGVFQPLGRRDPVTIADTRAADRGDVRFVVDTDAQRDALDELLDSLEPLLLQGPPGTGWRDRYVVLGDLARARLVDKGFVSSTTEALPWTEVARPAGAVDEFPTGLVS